MDNNAFINEEAVRAKVAEGEYVTAPELASINFNLPDNVFDIKSLNGKEISRKLNPEAYLEFISNIKPIKGTNEHEAILSGIKTLNNITLDENNVPHAGEVVITGGKLYIASYKGEENINKAIKAHNIALTNAITPNTNSPYAKIDSEVIYNGINDNGGR